MTRRNPQAAGVGERPNRSRPKDVALLVEIAEQPIGDFRDFLAPKDTDQRIDVRSIGKQLLALPFGQASRNDDTANAAVALQRQHLVNGGKRLVTCLLDEAAGVDNHKISVIGIGNQLVAIQFQQPQHSFAVD